MISIVIPTFNRAGHLKRALASIAELDYANDFEVIVMDNGSSDETKQVCGAYADQIKKLVYCYNDIPGLLTGRHGGMQLAKGELLAFIDDDVELSRGWLAGIEQSFKEEEVAFVTGPCLPKYEAYPPSWLAYFWSGSPLGGKVCSWLSLLDLGPESVPIDPDYVWGLNFSVRKETLVRLGGFHPDCVPKSLQHFQGDGETGLTTKAKKEGLKAVYNPDVLLYHYVSVERMTPEYFKQRAIYQGYCNSFTDIRSSHFKDNASETPPAPAMKWSAKILLAVKRKWASRKANEAPPEIVNMKKVLDEMLQQGYGRHQKAFKNNNLVKEWVLRENYWDFKLPDNDRKD